MELLLVKNESAMIAAYDSDADKLARFGQGEMVLCKITRPRNIKFHRKFFALLNLVFHNQEAYTNIEDLREVLIIAAGFYTLRQNLDGVWQKKADSISFANMDEDTFSDLYNKVIDVVVKWIGCDRDDLLEAVAEFM